MEMFVEAMKSAKEEFGISTQPRPNGTDDYDDYQQTFETNHRRLLDVAWKIYDMTSEMKSLKEDVNCLCDKIEHFAIAKEDDESSALEADKEEVLKDSESKEDRNAEGIDERFLKRNALDLTKRKERKVSFLADDDDKNGNKMDDLSFSIFKEIADDIMSRLNDSLYVQHSKYDSNSFN
eukprot:gene16004-17619_t